MGWLASIFKRTRPNNEGTRLNKSEARLNNDENHPKNDGIHLSNARDSPQYFPKKRKNHPKNGRIRLRICQTRCLSLALLRIYGPSLWIQTCLFSIPPL